MSTHPGSQTVRRGLWPTALLAMGSAGPASALGAALGAMAHALLPGFGRAALAEVGAGVGAALGGLWYARVGRKWVEEDGDAEHGSSQARDDLSRGHGLAAQPREPASSTHPRRRRHRTLECR